MRTTIDVDAPILKDIKQLQRTEGKSLARVFNELLAAALRSRGQRSRKKRKLRLPAKAMGQRVDIEDREALWSLLSTEESGR